MDYDEICAYNLTYKHQPHQWELFIDLICTPGKEVIWIKKNHKFYSRSLTTVGKCWLNIINTRLMPSTNATEVNGFRAGLIYCLRKGLIVEPVQLIQYEMLDKATTQRYEFFFPILVTRLCVQVRVKGKPNDVTIKAARKFRADKMSIGKDLAEEVAAGESDDSDDREGPHDATAQPIHSTHSHSWEEHSKGCKMKSLKYGTQWEN